MKHTQAVAQPTTDSLSNAKGLKSVVTILRSPTTIFTRIKPINLVHQRRAMLGALVAGCGLFLTGCSERSTEWSLYDVKGHLPDLKFSLQGAGNKTITEKDFASKTVLMFFGYASCPDICPTTMAQLTDVLGRLGDDASNVRIIFVSVDPHRDTPDVLQAYVDAFNKHAIGLTGTERQIADLAKRYRVAYQIEKPKSADNPDVYDVTHSRGVFFFDNKGKARLLASDTDNVDHVTRDLKKLLEITKS